VQQNSHMVMKEIFECRDEKRSTVFIEQVLDCRVGEWIPSENNVPP
jgi:hypothetical protein